MRAFFFLFIFGISIHSSAQQVSFAERNPADTGLSVYFDQFGMVYPPISLTEEDIKLSEYSIENYYSNNPIIADSLFNSYAIAFTQPYSDLSLRQLNDSLLFNLTKQIESALNGKMLIFGIHGYRKSYLENQQDVTSVKEFGLLDDALNGYKTNEFKLVRIYWDATYDCCYSMNRKENTYLFELFEIAYGNADKVGKSFQTFLSYFNTDQIGIVAHSLGSKVAVTSVINCPNAQTKFNVALIEPAISSDLIEEQYESQAQHADISWLILHNENDFVLRKKDNKLGWFGPGCYAYGETTLGMNKKHSAEHLQKWMSELNPAVTCTLKDMSDLGKVHSLRAYLAVTNFKETAEFLTTRR